MDTARVRSNISLYLKKKSLIQNQQGFQQNIKNFIFKNLLKFFLNLKK